MMLTESPHEETVLISGFDQENPALMKYQNYHNYRDHTVSRQLVNLKVIS
jgi:hypothetical protein